MSGPSKCDNYVHMNLTAHLHRVADQDICQHASQSPKQEHLSRREAVWAMHISRIPAMRCSASSQSALLQSAEPHSQTQGMTSFGSAVSCWMASHAAELALMQLVPTTARFAKPMMEQAALIMQRFLRESCLPGDVLCLVPEVPSGNCHSSWPLVAAASLCDMHLADASHSAALYHTSTFA